MNPAGYLTIIILICLCALAISGCISAGPDNNPAEASHKPTPVPVDIKGSDLALQQAAKALEDGNKTAFMRMTYHLHGNVSGDVTSFDFSSPKAAALARGIKSAKLTGSEARVWRSIQMHNKDGNLSLLGDSIYDRVDYETSVDGETYTIIMVREIDPEWTIARIFSANDTFVETDGAYSSLSYYL